MDKNMINIDDLLKQRLVDGEEKERPGAWLKMQELLDKEMPVTKVPVAAFKWRRMFGYVAALLLVSAVGIGGYQMISSENNSRTAYDDMVTGMPGAGEITNSHTPGSGHSGNALGDTSNPLRNKNKATNTNTVTNNTSGTTASTTNTATGNTNNTAATTPQAPGKANKSAAEEIASDDKLLSNNRKKAIMASISSDKAKKSPVLTTTTNNNKSQQTTTNNNKQRQFGSAAANNTPADKPVGNHTNDGNKKVNVADIAHTTTNNNKPAVNPANTANSANVAASAAKTGKKPASGNVDPDYLLSKQVVPTIEVRETYDRKVGWKKDTTIGKAEMEVLTPAEKLAVDMGTSAEKQNNIAKVSEPAVPAKRNRPLITVTEEDNITAQVVPSSAMSLSANAANNESLVPLANFKVSSKQNANYARTNFIEQMVQNAKVNIGNAKFYGGIVGGLNTSLSGNNSMWGFQLGLSGTLSLNERWGIVSELKYLHRFNKAALRNDGYANLDEGIDANGVTTYTWDSVNRSFKFPTVSAMELPVYIRYSLNRLNFHAGMNLVYNFTINNIDADSFGIRKTNHEGPVLQGAVNYSFQDGVPRIAMEDFASRFSLAYLFGVGYQFTPAIQLDVRMSKAFWDNAKTPGAKEISKKIYDVPSVQVNLSYRFGNNKFKPYRKN